MRHVFAITATAATLVFSSPAGADENLSALATRPLAEVAGLPVEAANGDYVGRLKGFGWIDGQLYAIVQAGGFLNLADHPVALPLEELTYAGGHIRVADATFDRFAARPDIDERAVSFAEDSITVSELLAR